MAKKDVDVTKDKPLMIEGAGIFEYGTITIKAGGTIQIGADGGDIIIRAEKIIKE